jgi:hypothetical protein
MNNSKSNSLASAFKDKPLHYPGQSLDKEINNLKLVIFTLAAGCVFFLLSLLNESLSWYFHTPPQPLVALVIALIFIPMFMLYMMRIQRRLQNYKLGSQGEKIVGEKLEDLRKEGYKIFHDVVGGNFNIDHIVVSPKGVFVIETKARSKRKDGSTSGRNQSEYEIESDGQTITLKGKKPDDEPIKQALKNAEWVRELLKQRIGKEYPITAVIAYPNWYVKELTNNDKIWVLNPDYLKWRIPQQSNKLGSDEIEFISSQLVLFVRTSDVILNK